MNVANYQQLMWDYDLPQDKFEAILQGRNVEGTMDQEWAIARVLENLNYYDAMSLVPYNILKEHWAGVKRKLFKDSIKRGYEFVLQRYSVSAAK